MKNMNVSNKNETNAWNLWIDFKGIISLYLWDSSRNKDDRVVAAQIHPLQMEVLTHLEKWIMTHQYLSWVWGY